MNTLNKTDIILLLDTVVQRQFQLNCTWKLEFLHEYKQLEVIKVKLKNILKNLEEETNADSN
ncbi:MAG: hypothetical protein [Bacteriophage sp.]|nr:MAG: hypothetical protein [Bacteriophage sp.]